MIGLFLVVFLGCPGVRADDLIWGDRPHPTAEHVYVEGGLYYRYAPQTSYGKIKNTPMDYIEYTVRLTAAPSVPIFSKLHWQSTPEVVLWPDTLKKSHSSSSHYKGFVELKSPFTSNILSHDTTWYLQYTQKGGQFSAKFKEPTVYRNGEVFVEHERVSFGNISSRYALAINTPISNDDSPYSYSRFGIYYQVAKRARDAMVNIDLEDVDEWLLDVQEKHGGIFFDFAKTAFTDALVLHLFLSAGFGSQEVRSNAFGLKPKDFESFNSLFFFDVIGGASYRFDITQKVGLRLFAEYEYDSILRLQSKSSDKSYFYNEDAQQFSAGVMLELLL